MSPAFSSEPKWLALGWAMLRFLWVGSAIAITASVIGRLVSRRAAAPLRNSFAPGVLIVLASAAALCIWLELPGAWLFHQLFTFFLRVKQFH